MDNAFSGVAFLTNSDQDIGLACAEVLIQSGCTRIIIGGRSLAVLRSTQEYLANRYSTASVRAWEYDTNTFAGVEKAVRGAAAIYGTINYVINCQSLSQFRARPTAEIGLQDLQDALNSTSRELWMFCKAQISYFTSRSQTSKGDHAVVNIIPYGNNGTHAGHSLYAVSSYSAVGITKSVAQDLLHSRNIRLNAVCPGATNSIEDQRLSTIDLLKRDDGVGRLIDVREVATAAVFMVGENSSAIHGVVLPVDAGRCLMHN